MRTPQLTTYTPPRNRPLVTSAYSTEGSCAFLTIRADRGRPFERNETLCARVIELLAEMRGEYGCWVGAYCVMPDHLHFVAGTREDGASVLTFVERFKGKTTNESWKCGWSGKLWQKRQHDHVLRSAESLDDIYEYILNNPVRAELVEHAEQWRWSGILDEQP